MSEPTCRSLSYSGADCLSNVRTYLPGTVLQWCRLFQRCQNLPAGHCVAGVQTVKVVSEPICWALFYGLKAVLAMSESTFFLLFIFYCQYVIQNTIHNYASVTKQTYTATVFKICINLCSLMCLQI